MNRWVGIDGVMAVVSKTEKLKTKLLIDSLKEKKNTKEANFYERNFNIKTIENIYGICKPYDTYIGDKIFNSDVRHN